MSSLKLYIFSVSDKTPTQITEGNLVAVTDNNHIIDLEEWSNAYAQPGCRTATPFEKSGDRCGRDEDVELPPLWHGPGVC